MVLELRGILANSPFRQPRKEYFIIHDLMQRHETLSDELRSAFYNSRDVGFLYLEAKFTKSGISSLREVLREYSDLKLSSIAVVPEADLQKCLTLAYDSQPAQQVFAGGQWVQIKRGLYRGDIGLVLEDFRDGDSSTGVRVFVIPRLDSTNEDRPSTSKRKRRIRPSPRLFNPTECNTEQLVRHRKPHVFSYAAWRFEYGLQIKTYSAQSLSLAREVPASAYKLFMEAKAKGADVDIHSMPIPSFWRFDVGEQVLVGSGLKYGTIVSGFNPATPPLRPCVEVDSEEGRQLVHVKNITKAIILGQHIDVLAGIHSGKKGFVVAQDKSLLGICTGTSGVVSKHESDITISISSVCRTSEFMSIL